jgi:hypothetical protein
MKVRVWVILLCTALGLTLAWRGLQTYMDDTDPRYARQPRPSSGTARPSAPVAATPELPPLPPDAPRECVNAREPGPAGLANALAALPTEDKAYEWNLTPAVRCMLEVVSARAADDPVRAREVLMHGVFSSNAGVRTLAFQGFRRIDLPDMPAALQLKALSKDDSERAHAVEALLAMNAIEHMPGIVSGALDDPSGYIRGAARHALLESSGPAAPRLIAHALSLNRQSLELRRLFEERERARHDVSPALADVALDESLETPQRVNALEVVSGTGDIGLAALLAPLRQSSDSRLAATADATIAAFELRKSRGARSALPPEPR